MTIIEMINAALVVAEGINKLIVSLIANAKSAGELTTEQEADYQKRQADIYSKDYSKPE